MADGSWVGLLEGRVHTCEAGNDRGKRGEYRVPNLGGLGGVGTCGMPGGAQWADEMPWKATR